MPTITLPRHKITLAETVSWLAWERCFSQEDFTAAVGVEDHSKQIGRLAKTLKELKKGREAQRKKIHNDLDFCQQKIDYGESLIRVFEEASGHRFSWPDDGASDYSIELDLFEKSISDVLLDLWEAAGSEKVKVWGKRKRNNEGDEEKISRRWFWWSQNPPKAYLTHGYIEHRENSAPTEHIWRNVHFEKPEIEALRKERPESGHGLRASEALKMAVGFGFPFAAQPVEHDPTGIRPLMDRLTAGAWHATGWPVTDAGPSKREPIPRDSWKFLIINFANNSAAGGGKQFEGLRIFRGSPSPPAKRPGLKGERAPRSDGGQEFTIGEIAVRILDTHSSSPSVDLGIVIGQLFEQVEGGKLCVLYQDVPTSEDGGVSEFWWKYWGDKEDKSVVEHGNLVLVSTEEMTRFCDSEVFLEWAIQRGLCVPALFGGEVAPMQEGPPVPSEDVETTGLSQAGRAKGGRRGKWNLALQKAIDRVQSEIVSRENPTTLSTVKDWFRENASSDNPYSFEPPIPNCDDLYIDGNKLVWKDRDGRECDVALVSLRRYIDRAKQRE